jgi:hypothetical protein
LAVVGYLQIRASATDQDRTIDVLKAAFVEGRLTKQELDQRVGQALSQRYFADLIALIEDLPAGAFARLPAHRATPASPPTARLGPAIFPIGAAFLAVGIYDGSLLFSVIFGIPTLIAAGTLLRAVRADRRRAKRLCTPVTSAHAGGAFRLERARGSAARRV